MTWDFMGINRNLQGIEGDSNRIHARQAAILVKIFRDRSTNGIYLKFDHYILIYMTHWCIPTQSQKPPPPWLKIAHRQIEIGTGHPQILRNRGSAEK
jgi:hypothetical protein